MGRRLQSDSVTTGRNKDLGSLQEDNYMKCSRCRFMVKIQRHPKAQDGSKQGWGMRFDDTDTSDIKDPVVVGGCPQCGTYLYNKET